MWVYIFDSAKSVFIVGFYNPQGQFLECFKYTDKIDAVKQVHYMNGGN
jgi:hypothetical protein